MIAGGASRAPDRISAAAYLQAGAAARSRRGEAGQISQGNRESSRAICLPAHRKTDERVVIVLHSWTKRGQTGVLDCGSALAARAEGVADGPVGGQVCAWIIIERRRRARPGMTALHLR